MRRTFCRVAAVVGLLLLLQTTAAHAIPAPTERLDGTPSEWYWLYNVTPQQVTDLLNDTGSRLIDIEVQSTDPLRFAAAFVQNEGVHQVSSWWWYYNATQADVSNLLETNQARLIDIERYDGDRFAVIMVNNTGTEAKTWWWYVNQSVSQMSGLLEQNEARLIDFESRDTGGGGTLIDGIMVRNSGDDASGWYWWLNVDEAFISAQIQETGYRIVDLDVVESSGEPRFDVIMMPPESKWWWYFGITPSQITSFVDQLGARIVDIEPYPTLSGTRYAIALTNNSNELTTRLATELGYGTDGTTGLYLRRIGGPTLAQLNPDFRFEPASTIKVFHHFHAWRMIANGVDQTNSLLVYGEGMNGSCPDGSGPTAARSLYETTRRMMWFSDNPATEALRARYGETDIMNSVRTWGGVSTDSDLNHAPLGCGTQAVANPNELTLRDAGNLYEQIAQGIAVQSVRTELYETMQSHLTPESDQWWLTDQVQQMVVDEANAAGIAHVAPFFWDEMEIAWKPGGYTLNGKNFVSVAGTINVPECVRTRFSDRDYVFGLFLHDANDTQRLFDVTQELFRDLIREGLEDCANATSAPSAPVARSLTLENAVPNPFNPSTQIRFTLAEAGPVVVDVFDPRGRVVATLAEGHHAAGEHTVRWDGRDRTGAPVSSGVYFVKARAADEVQTRKITLLE